MSSLARRQYTHEALPGYPITYEPGDRVSWLLDGRLYLGMVEDSRCTSETFEVLWFATGRRGRFVHGAEPRDFGHTQPTDRVVARQQSDAAGRISELAELLTNYKQWPREVRDVLSARFRARTGAPFSAGR